MAFGKNGRPGSAGPGNKTIATMLLELLAVRGRAGARERAMRALALGEGAGLADAPAWLASEALDRMLVAADVDAGLARAIGHRLCAPDATGLPLYGLGLATPEKAYRRIQSLLPRAARDACWHVESMGDAHAVLVFESQKERANTKASARGSDAVRAAALQCALRVGQLEAIPGLYGLLPARVTSPTCLARGDAECRYVVDWRRGERAGLMAGGAAGGLAGLLACFVGPDGAVGIGIGLVLAALGLTAGRCVDLHRQLRAVAGARRGHLALFDQVDAVLAEKLDQISRLDATLAPGPRFPAALERASTLDEDPLAFVDLRRLVAAAIEKAKPQVAEWAEIRFDCDARLPKVACEPVQIEQVVDELLQNAVEASLGAGESPVIEVALRSVGRGVELSIADQGQGIDANDVDETFDPFFDERPVGLERGFGLPVCLRIVEAHGGELRIQNEGRIGTRVTILLPAEHDAVPPSGTVEGEDE